MKRRRGFTLLELTVALLIFSFVIGAVYALFDSTRGLSSRAEFRAEMFQTARAALQALEDDLRGAMMSGTSFDTGLIGRDQGTDGTAEDEIEVISVAPRVQGAPAGWKPGETPATWEDRESRTIDVGKVTYWLEPDAQKEARGLVRERLKVLNPPAVYVRRDEDVEEVAREVVSLNLRYWDDEWKDSWDSTVLRRLPKAIEATLVIRGEWRGEEIRQTFSTRIYLPVGAETPERQPQ